MSQIFNTTFEMSLRIILLLWSADGAEKSSDMLVLTDTIAIYGGEFGLADMNLHGGIDYVLDEYDTRRELTKTALKDLVLRGLARISESDEGFRYAITERGETFAAKLESDYAAEYRELARAANRLTAAKSERETLNMISEACKSVLEGRRENG